MGCTGDKKEKGGQEQVRMLMILVRWSLSVAESLQY